VQVRRALALRRRRSGHSAVGGGRVRGCVPQGRRQARVDRLPRGAAQLLRPQANGVCGGVGRRLAARAGVHSAKYEGLRIGCSGADVAARPNVVGGGGGFGGPYAARALAGRPLRVTLLDRRNHHLSQPLLYQVATAALNPSDIAAPLRSVLRRAHNVTVLLAEVRHVDLAARRLTLPPPPMGYAAPLLPPA